MDAEAAPLVADEGGEDARVVVSVGGAIVSSQAARLRRRDSAPKAAEDVFDISAVLSAQ